MQLKISILIFWLPPLLRKLEISRLWNTDRHVKVEQYSVWAESAILINSIVLDLFGLLCHSCVVKAPPRYVVSFFIKPLLRSKQPLYNFFLKEAPYLGFSEKVEILSQPGDVKYNPNYSSETKSIAWKSQECQIRIFFCCFDFFFFEGWGWGGKRTFSQPQPPG